MLDDSDKQVIATMIATALGSVTSRLDALAAPVDVSGFASTADLSAMRSEVAALHQNVDGVLDSIGNALGSPAAIKARNSRVDFVLGKYYGTASDFPPGYVGPDGLAADGSDPTKNPDGTPKNGR